MKNIRHVELGSTPINQNEAFSDTIQANNESHKVVSQIRKESTENQDIDLILPMDNDPYLGLSMLEVYKILEEGPFGVSDMIYREDIFSPKVGVKVIDVEAINARAIEGLRQYVEKGIWPGNASNSIDPHTTLPCIEFVLRRLAEGGFIAIQLIEEH